MPGPERIDRRRAAGIARDICQRARWSANSEGRSSVRDRNACIEASHRSFLAPDLRNG